MANLSLHMGNRPCLLHTQFITELVIHKPHRHEHTCDNLCNLVTTVYSTLCPIWKFQVDYSHCISTPNGECVCYTCTCDWEPACAHNPILHTCGYFAMSPQMNGLTGLCSRITPKEENKTKAISFQSSWQWCSFDSTEFWVWWDFIRSSNACRS